MSTLNDAKYELLLWDGSTTKKVKYTSLVTGLNADLNVPVDLTYTPAADGGSVGDGVGTAATLTLADETNAGLITPADFSKLALYPVDGDAGDVVQWDGKEFVTAPATAKPNLDDLLDVTAQVPTKGQVLVVNPGTVAGDKSDQYILDTVPLAEIYTSDSLNGQADDGTPGGIKLAEYVDISGTVTPSNLTITTDGFLVTTIPAALNYRNVVSCLRPLDNVDTITIDGSDRGSNKSNIRTPPQTGDVYVNVEAGFPNEKWPGLMDPNLYQDAKATVASVNGDSEVTALTLDTYQKGWRFIAGETVNISDGSGEFFAGLQATIDTVDANGIITGITVIDNPGMAKLSVGDSVVIVNNGTDPAAEGKQNELQGGELIAYGEDEITADGIWRVIGKIGVDEVTAFVKLNGDTMTGALTVPGLTVSDGLDLTVNSGGSIIVTDGSLGVTKGSLSIQDGGISQKGGFVSFEPDTTTGLAYYGDRGDTSPDFSTVDDNVLITKKYVADTVTSIGAITAESLPIYSTEATNDGGGDPRIKLSAVDGFGAVYGVDTEVTIGGGIHTDVVIDTGKILVNSTGAKVWEGSNPPSDADVQENDLWYNDVDGRLYFYYSNGADAAQWVDASPSAIDGSDYVAKAGDTIEGDITFATNATPHTLTCFHYGIESLPTLPVRG